MAWGEFDGKQGTSWQEVFYTYLCFAGFGLLVLMGVTLLWVGIVCVSVL